MILCAHVSSCVRSKITILLYSALVLPLMIGILGGCASMRQHATETAIVVRTEPPGASILVKGKVVATTPAYIALDRSHKSEFSLLTANGIQTVPVKTHYRWLQSFAANLIFYVFAPIGWTIDTISGTAWELESPPVLPVQLAVEDARRAAQPKPPKVVAIAPPLADQIALSDVGGRAIQSVLDSRKKNYRVLPFEKTLQTFLNAGYDYDGAPQDNDRNWLYYSLGVSSVFESTIETEGDHLRLRSQERDLNSETISKSFDLSFDPEGDFGRIYTKNVWWSRLLPDTAAIDFVSSQIRVTNGDKTYDLAPSSQEDWLATSSRYLGALNITSLPPRRYGRAARFTFTLVPVVRVSRKQVTADDLPGENAADESDQTFTRWLVTAGYGPEFGWQVSRHYLYVNIIPVFYWSQIAWKVGDQKHSVTNTAAQASVELGYIFYLSQHWNLRLFTRTQNEDASGWSEALSNRLPGGATATTSVSLNVSGLSVGYRFEPDARLRTKISELK